MTIIKYNSQELQLPTPLVEIDRENLYNNPYAGFIDKIKLKGEFVGETKLNNLNLAYPFDSLIFKQKNLIDLFSKNFKKLEILEAKDSSETFSKGEFIQANSDNGIDGYRQIVWNSDRLKKNTLYEFYYINTSFIYKKAEGPRFGIGNGVQASITLPLPSSATIIRNPVAGYQNYFASAGVYLSDSQGGCAVWMVSPFFYLSNILAYGEVGLTTSTSSNPGIFYLREQRTFNKIYEKDVIVKSINFDKSRYSALLGYTVELESYNYSSSVKNPVDEYSFSQEKNNTVNLVHRVSAEGLNNQSNPNSFQKAIDFVKNRTGILNIPSGYFTSGKNYFLNSFKESIDRINASYSIEETFSTANFLNTGNLNYSLNIASGKGNDSTRLELNGNLTCQNENDLEILENNINPVVLVNSLYSGYFNPNPISFNINKNKDKKEIGFSYVFDDINVPNPYVTYNISKNTDYINEITNITLTINLATRGINKIMVINGDSFIDNAGEMSQILMPVQPYIIADNAYRLNAKYNTNSRSIKLINWSTAKNIAQNTFQYSLSYSDKNIPSGFIDGSSSFQYQLPVKILKSNPNVGSSYVFQDFNINSLGKLSINSDLVVSKNSLWTGNKPYYPDENIFFITNDSSSYNKNNGNIKYTIDSIRKTNIWNIQPISNPKSLFDIKISQ